MRNQRQPMIGLLRCHCFERQSHRLDLQYRMIEPGLTGSKMGDHTTMFTAVGIIMMLREIRVDQRV